MKRFTLILVLVMVLSSLGIETTKVYASTNWNTVLAAVGNSGESGTITLTAADPTISPTEIYITDHTASGAPVSGQRPTSIYSGKCNSLGVPLYSLPSIANGISDTPSAPYSLNALTGKSPTYAIVANDPATNLPVSCGDVGMPSVTFPRVLPFRLVYDPVTQPSVAVETVANNLRVTISLSGQLTGTQFPAYVRKGTCDNLDPGPPAYTLNDVVNGQSTTFLVSDGVLPDGLAITTEEPGAPVGKYLACTETGTYSVLADLQPLNDSGVSGQVTATDKTQHSQTNIAIKLSEGQSSPPANVVQDLSANIYTGSCPNANRLSAFPLGRLVSGSLVKDVSVSINELTRGVSPYAILVNKFTSGRITSVACADIPYFGSTPNPAGPLPGMPTTGNANPVYTTVPPALIALGLVMLILGLWLMRRVVRRAAASRVRKE